MVSHLAHVKGGDACYIVSQTGSDWTGFEAVCKWTHFFQLLTNFFKKSKKKM
jgi:hypothetical protein